MVSYINEMQTQSTLSLAELEIIKNYKGVYQNNEKLNEELIEICRKFPFLEDDEAKKTLKTHFMKVVTPNEEIDKITQLFYTHFRSIKPIAPKRSSMPVLLVGSGSKSVGAKIAIGTNDGDEKLNEKRVELENAINQLEKTLPQVEQKLRMTLEENQQPSILCTIISLDSEQSYKEMEVFVDGEDESIQVLNHLTKSSLTIIQQITEYLKQNKLEIKKLQEWKESVDNVIKLFTQYI